MPTSVQTVQVRRATAKPSPLPCYSELIGALSHPDPSRRLFAILMFERLGEQAIPIIVAEASVRRYEPRLCLRLLDAIKEITVRPDLGGFLDLLLLKQDRHRAVRQGITRLLRRLERVEHDVITISTATSEAVCDPPLAAASCAPAPHRWYIG